MNEVSKFLCYVHSISMHSIAFLRVPFRNLPQRPHILADVGKILERRAENILDIKSLCFKKWGKHSFLEPRWSSFPRFNIRFHFLKVEILISMETKRTSLHILYSWGDCRVKKVSTVSYLISKVSGKQGFPSSEISAVCCLSQSLSGWFLHFWKGVCL